MAIIWSCPLTLSSYAAAGRAVPVPAQRCPACGRLLGGWGGYWRWVRPERQPEERLWVRRGRCAPCGRTHALLPSFLFTRRLDAAPVIGAALAAAADGSGARPVAARLAVPHATVRDWLRRVRTRAPALLAVLLALATRLDPAPVEVREGGVAGVLQALTITWERAGERLGERRPDRWAFWSLLSGGTALAANTSPPFPRRWDGRWMGASP